MTRLNKLFHTAMQLLWLTVLFFAVFAALCRDRRIAAPMLAVMELMLFELLFEARARYLFAYAPVYILLAAVGMNEIMIRFKER